MDAYSHLATAIIQEQETVIGPVAVQRAQKVKGIQIDWKAKAIQFSGDPKQVIDQLVAEYKDLFGQISVEVCKEAVKKLPEHLSPEQLPASLR